MQIGLSRSVSIVKKFVQTPLTDFEHDGPCRQSGVSGEKNLKQLLCLVRHAHRPTCLRVLQPEAFVLYTFCVVQLSISQHIRLDVDSSQPHSFLLLVSLQSVPACFMAHSHKPQCNSWASVSLPAPLGRSSGLQRLCHGLTVRSSALLFTGWLSPWACYGVQAGKV